MLGDEDLLEASQDTGEVSLFVPENEYETIEVPDAAQFEVRSPASELWGVSDEILDNTLFTRVKMDAADFISPPRRGISLLFVKKETVQKTPAAVAGMAPAFLVLGNNYTSSANFFIGQTSESENRMKLLLRETFLLLPLYLKARRALGTQGVDVALRNFYGSCGKLWARSFICRNIFLLGRSYFSLPDCRARYAMGYNFHSVWRNWHILQDIHERLEKGLMAYNISQITSD